MTVNRACTCSFGSCLCDCIFGTETSTGCCHKADTLLLWCSRPGYSTTQHYTFGNCETCYTTTVPSMDPVQAIYHYHSCRFRFVYPSGDPVTLLNMSPNHLPVADNTFNQGEACANPVCDTTPAYCPDDCCNVQFQGFQTCKCDTWFGSGIGGLSQWRYDQIVNSEENLWFAEMTCHKNGAPLSASPSIPRLSSGFLCIVHFERWWKIASDCPPGDRIYVPGCPGGSCSGIPYVTSDLVPEWWIFACSGIPLYQFELDEALEFGVIGSGEYDDIMDAIALKDQPPNAPLLKMAKAGYLIAKDWRKEQRDAFNDLHARFPSAGYGACVQNLSSMDELGPFRKRYTPSTAATNAVPYLHKDDVVTELDPFQATCMKNYPGSASNADDYRYWRERQWVYFRGVPGGWAWGDWGTTEDDLANGIGRNSGLGDPLTLIGSPLDAFRGMPRPPENCSSCAGICPGKTFCSMCDGSVYDPTNCPSCGNMPLAACDPPTECLRFTISPYCEGVHFVFSAYVYENDVKIVGGECVTEGTYRCHYQVHSFLVEARRSVDSWNDSVPWKCRGENPPLPTFNYWPQIQRAHLGISPMCNEIVNPQNNPPLYAAADLCCGGHCIGYVDTYYDWPTAPSGCPTVGPGGSEGPYPCPGIGPQDACSARNDCPPHSTQGQIDCIGHSIDCDPTP